MEDMTRPNWNRLILTCNTCNGRGHALFPRYYCWQKNLESESFFKRKLKKIKPRPFVIHAGSFLVWFHFFFTASQGGSGRCRFFFRKTKRWKPCCGVRSEPAGVCVYACFDWDNVMPLMSWLISGLMSPLVSSSTAVNPDQVNCPCNFF